MENGARVLKKGWKGRASSSDASVVYYEGEVQSFNPKLGWYYVRFCTDGINEIQAMTEDCLLPLRDAWKAHEAEPAALGFDVRPYTPPQDSLTLIANSIDGASSFFTPRIFCLAPPGPPLLELTTRTSSLPLPLFCLQR